jgi:SAM-dependent methyltransferase
VRVRLSSAGLRLCQPAWEFEKFTMEIDRKNQQSTPRTMQQIRYHYEVEKELAARLRGASREDRRRMYGQLYNELYSRVKDHPLLRRKSMSGEEIRHHRGVQSQLGFLRRFLLPTSVFLEIGAGSCIVSIEVAKQVKHVIAVDVSNEITRRNDLPTNLELRIFDGVEVPAEPDSVDLAYSHQVMEHVHPADAFEQLRCVYRSLAAGGAYVCVVPNRVSGPHDISRHFDQVATGFHMKEYTTAELASLFYAAGFRSVRSYVGARGHYFPVPRFFLTALERFLDRLSFGLRSQIGRRLPVRTLLEIRMAGWK